MEGFVAERPDFAKVRISGPDELAILCEVYAETYPVRPLLNELAEYQLFLADEKQVRRCAEARVRELEAALETIAQYCGNRGAAIQSVAHMARTALATSLMPEPNMVDFVGRLVGEWRGLSAKYSTQAAELRRGQERYHELVGMVAALDVCADRLEEDLAFKAEKDVAQRP